MKTVTTFLAFWCFLAVVAWQNFVSVVHCLVINAVCGKRQLQSRFKRFI